ncbi:hypothetical protein CH373_03350 [Leptospira perolatii]|uniref:Lipoprotein n=1 Tax=Leptospira perolatii TaxID=2023191 RepID=A0A2M9ZSL8_9LEPT|nr:hypothetical protein [Leptospira perolatii]PJZ71534.1 hypothetical protein CH360_03345 [Leptospira perolatii]PJZ75066.1 hypothetical protein CH373_03350 [Leptospira perolatii]
MKQKSQTPSAVFRLLNSVMILFLLTFGCSDQEQFFSKEESSLLYNNAKKYYNENLCSAKEKEDQTSLNSLFSQEFVYDDLIQNLKISGFNNINNSLRSSVIRDICKTINQPNNYYSYVSKNESQLSVTYSELFKDGVRILLIKIALSENRFIIKALQVGGN